MIKVFENCNNSNILKLQTLPGTRQPCYIFFVLSISNTSGISFSALTSFSTSFFTLATHLSFFTETIFLPPTEIYLSQAGILNVDRTTLLLRSWALMYNYIQFDQGTCVRISTY